MKERPSDLTPSMNTASGSLTEIQEQLRQAQRYNNVSNGNVGEYFGLAVKGTQARSLELKFRNGRMFFLRYAYQFNLDLPTNGQLILMVTSARIKVIIEGRKLDILARPLARQEVMWVKESENPLMADGEGLFVSSIKISGKAFED